MVKRYYLGRWSDGTSDMQDESDGEWVKYEDYAALEQQLLALRKERERAQPMFYVDGNAAKHLLRGYTRFATMTVEPKPGLSLPLYIAPPPAQPVAVPVELTVWYGCMPETNGKSNWTAILHRKGEPFSSGITIDCSEHPDRVRYEADRMRYLIGELSERPFILNYDADKHSGYIAPQPVAVLDDSYLHLSELYHAQEKRLFKLAQRIKGPAFDKYAYSPSHAIDVLEAAIFGENDDACRAAMLEQKK